MKCFIHVSQDAISVCKRCGKAMCADCSSYSQHSGICPECRRDEFIKERASLQKRLRENKQSIILSCIVIVLFIALAIWLFVDVMSVLGGIVLALTIGIGIRVAVLFSKRKPMINRINFLTGEINKLTWSLSKGAGVI